jgi:hypothetical protein
MMIDSRNGVRQLESNNEWYWFVDSNHLAYSWQYNETNSVKIDRFFVPIKSQQHQMRYSDAPHAACYYDLHDATNFQHFNSVRQKDSLVKRHFPFPPSCCPSRVPTIPSLRVRYYPFRIVTVFWLCVWSIRWLAIYSIIFCTIAEFLD